MVNLMTYFAKEGCRIGAHNGIRILDDTNLRRKKTTSTILYQNVVVCVAWSSFPSLLLHYEGLKLVSYLFVSLCLFICASQETFAEHLEPKIK